MTHTNIYTNICIWIKIKQGWRRQCLTIREEFTNGCSGKAAMQDKVRERQKQRQGRCAWPPRLQRGWNERVRGGVTRAGSSVSSLGQLCHPCKQPLSLQQEGKPASASQQKRDTADFLCHPGCCIDDRWERAGSRSRLGMGTHRRPTLGLGELCVLGWGGGRSRSTSVGSGCIGTASPTGFAEELDVGEREEI
jgi:hypothetical protein